jgi:hypothetical protein
VRFSAKEERDGDPIIACETHVGLVSPLSVSLKSAPQCRHVEAGVVRGSLRYVVEDQPEAVTDLIERYASPHSQ